MDEHALGTAEATYSKHYSCTFTSNSTSVPNDVALVNEKPFMEHYTLTNEALQMT
jgi:hypothetical protein